MNDYLVFALAFAASAAAPGPEISSLLGRALAGGMRSSLPLAVGIVAGKLLLLTAACIGLSVLVGVLGPVFGVLKWAGAGYLLWLGLKKWRCAGKPPASTALACTPGLMPEIGLGMTMTLSNPIAIVFYLALLPGVVGAAAVTAQRFLSLCAIIVVVMGAVTIGYGLMAELVRKLFSSNAAKANIDRAAALMLLCAAIVIALR